MPSMSVNGLDFLISHVEDLARKALRYPNWINLDFVEYGDGKEVVRYCNEKLHQTSPLNAKRPELLAESYLVKDEDEEKLQEEDSKE